VLISTVHDGDVDAVVGEAFSNGSADALVPSGDDGRPRHVQQQLQPSGLDRLEEHLEAADRPVYDMVRRARRPAARSVRHRIP